MMEAPKFEQTLPRPTEYDFEEKVRQMKIMHEGKNRKHGVEENDFQANLDEIKEYASGAGDQEDMTQWYPGWTQNDFNELLDRLTNEGLIS